MEYKQEDYGEKYFSSKERMEWKHYVICSEIFKSYRPYTLLDYGCGAGQYVRIFNDMGVNAFGYEPSSYACGQKIHTGKMSTNLPVLDYDTVICFDVAEHVPIDEVDNFLQKIKKVSVKNFICIFSICFSDNPDFQYDSTHVTKRSKEWWIYKLYQNGYQLMRTPKDWIYKNQTVVAHVEVENNEKKSECACMHP